MSATIEQLEVEVQSSAMSAVGGIDALASSLGKLKTAVKGGVGLTSVAKQLTTLNTALSSVSAGNAENLNKLANGLKTLSSCGSLKLSSSVATQITNIGSAIQSLNGTNFGALNSLTNALTSLTNIGKSNLNSFISQLQRLPQAVQALSSVNIGSLGSQISQLVSALTPLTQMGKNNLTSFITQLQKLPQVMTALRSVDMSALNSQIQQLANALAPLATQMQSIANGFSAFPARIQKLIKSTNKLTTANDKASTSYANLAAKIGMAWVAMKRIASVIASWITESNEYVENLNLFTVSMGKYAEEAQAYAESVAEIMGIDPGEWLRNQGIFMTLATGFGVVSDRAYIMSKNLTQLGYDLSSFFNISFEDAMQKLQSGISGELEPLRRLGYDLSQARLEAIALSLGIDKTVSSMTQAEKAELRYYAIMTQVTTAQGDMARTLNAPANQLRILKAQLTQCARALGNVFIPALNAVLPYAIAVTKVIRLIADAIATLVGFTLPEVDYSSLDSSVGSVSDSLEEANTKATEFSKTLLGIDELNVMPSNSSSEGSDGSGTGFDFELPSYDFISEAVDSRVNELVEKMKEWLGITGEIDSWSDLFNTRLGRILTLVGGIGAGIALWKLTKGFLDGITALKALLASPSQSIALGLVITITGFAIEFSGISDAIANGLDGFNFSEIVLGGLLGTGGAAILGKGIASWIATAFADSAVTGALTTAATNLFGAETAATMGASAAGMAGAALAAGVAGIIAGIPAYITGIYDAITNGIDWLSSALIGAGATAAGAGIGAIVGACGGPIGAGIGALIGLAVGLITDLVILIVQKWDVIVEWCATACASIGEFFSNMWDGICGIWSIVSEWFNTNVVQPISNFFSGLWEGKSNTASSCWDSIVTFFTPAVEWFSQLFGSIWQTISDVFYNIGVIASGCWQIIQAVWSIVSEWFNANIVQPVGTFFSGLWEGIKNAAIIAWNEIKSVFSTIGNWINSKVIQPVSNFFSNLWTGFVTKAKTAWAGVKQVFGTVATFFKDTFKKAWQGIVNVFSVAGEIFVDIKDGILSGFKKVVNGIIKGLNSAIAVPFNGINSALSFIKNIKILDFKPFSGIRTISVPQIPYLASGGVVDSGQMFIAREAGAELVGNVGNKTAVMNNDQIVESVADGVYRAVLAAMSQSDNGETAIYIDGRRVFEVVKNYNTRERIRTGVNPLMG